MFNLGLSYLKMDGFEYNEKKAKQMFEKAANLNNAGGI